MLLFAFIGLACPPSLLWRRDQPEDLGQAPAGISLEATGGVLHFNDCTAPLA